MSVRILIGDCVKRMGELPDNSVDSIVCDPPYGLEFMGKEWDAPWKQRGEKRAGAGFTEGGFKEGNGYTNRKTPSFGKAWSNKRCTKCGKISSGGSPCRCPDPEWVVERGKTSTPMRGFQDWCEEWAIEAMRVLKPGGHLVAFSGTRTYHRMAVAIEDAGFEIRDQLSWVYGSGFPKSLDVSKAIDKAAGAEREVVGRVAGMGKQNPEWNGTAQGRAENSFKPVYDATAPATDAARQWQGWGTALKPAWEPICLARKPITRTVASNVLEHGTGALNIDGCRIGGESTLRPTFAKLTSKGASGGALGNQSHDLERREDALETGSPLGRWPANIIHDGSDEVVAAFPESSGGHDPAKSKASPFGGVNDSQREERQWGDSGSAARFFYCAKTATEERNAGLDCCETVSIVGTWESAGLNLKLLVDTAPSPPKVIAVSGMPNADVTQWNTWLFGSENEDRSLAASSFTTSTVTNSTTGSKTWSCLLRSLTSGSIVAAKCATASGGSPVETAAPSTPSITITSEQTAFIPGVGPAPSGTQLKISVSEGWPGHPTVKPIALMQWLVRLVTPKGGTVLDPFMGSGSTGLACQREQMSFIGCEMSPEYAAIAERRLNDAGGLFAQVEVLAA